MFRHSPRATCLAVATVAALAVVAFLASWWGIQAYVFATDGRF